MSRKTLPSPSAYVPQQEDSVFFQFPTFPSHFPLNKMQGNTGLFIYMLHQTHSPRSHQWDRPRWERKF